MARILIVDDNESDRILMGTILERAGHETFLVKDVDGALKESRGREMELVITDLQMPGVHGLELITLLRDLSPRPAIIAVSGTGSVQLDMARAIGAGAILVKPVDPWELLDVVKKAVARKA